ncbi:MAG: hypothetical protein QOE14_426 [Humisphaera sp.]|nr:hypothetical protein [Humisphaera sp.]
MNLPTLDDNNGNGGSPTARPQVCRLLRTKTAFGSYMLETDDAENEPSWQDGNSTTAVFWCLKTMDTCGPDDAFAHAKSCRPGRECFRGDDD